MVRPELAAEKCLDLDTDCEIKWVKVAVSKSENILIGSYYREPKSKLQALEELDKSLSKIANSNVYKNMKLFIDGDFNLGDIDWSLGHCVAGARDKNHCEKLINISNNHLLEQVNTLPTRHGRILDLLFTSHSSLILRHTIILSY